MHLIYQYRFWMCMGTSYHHIHSWTCTQFHYTVESCCLVHYDLVYLMLNLEKWLINNVVWNHCNCICLVLWSSTSTTNIWYSLQSSLWASQTILVSWLILKKLSLFSVSVLNEDNSSLFSPISESNSVIIKITVPIDISTQLDCKIVHKENQHIIVYILNNYLQ